MSYEYILKNEAVKTELVLMVSGGERPKYFKRPIVPLLQVAPADMY